MPHGTSRSGSAPPRPAPHRRSLAGRVDDDVGELGAAIGDDADHSGDPVRLDGEVVHAGTEPQVDAGFVLDRSAQHPLEHRATGVEHHEVGVAGRTDEPLDRRRAGGGQVGVAAAGGRERGQDVRGLGGEDGAGPGQEGVGVRRPAAWPGVASAPASVTSAGVGVGSFSRTTTW